MAGKGSYEELKAKPREIIANALPGDADLGPLSLLPGRWSNDKLAGRGWNLIALPFVNAGGGGPIHYRLLMNQYNEELKFTLVDKGVPNRGIDLSGTPHNIDQLIVTLDYEQSIVQIAADDNPNSGLAGSPNSAIHHEPGLWLHMKNELTEELDIGRLATIPHGDSVLALGKSSTDAGPPSIAPVSALPSAFGTVSTHPLLAPYKHFIDNPFRGVQGPGFPGFISTNTTALLQGANAAVNIAQTTTLDVDTAVETGGIVNIPFVVKQANAVEMKSTFWIQEMQPDDKGNTPKPRLQYLQIVILEFEHRLPDGSSGPVRFPHISINTMERD